ncbi:MazG-like family protein [Paenibacillus sp. 481]|uniref:MazG-like family protein n=1 Tax=Paenibacillus sp. 481 TaxID=2835869 RepID=UPI001E2BC41A|nr:MazG-like family protein [Paenibacillus sp. 481]UHA72182.1 MazG-like family protein [Paenibacillus sp. 481]
MEMKPFQEWVHDFYSRRNWAQYNSFIRVGFLMEEVGEVSRVVRAIEIGRDRPDEAKQSEEELRQELVEELGDVLANLIILADKYDIELSEVAEAHIAKLTERFKEQLDPE